MYLIGKSEWLIRGKVYGEEIKNKGMKKKGENCRFFRKTEIFRGGLLPLNIVQF